MVARAPLCSSADKTFSALSVMGWPRKNTEIDHCLAERGHPILCETLTLWLGSVSTVATKASPCEVRSVLLPGAVELRSALRAPRRPHVPINQSNHLPSYACSCSPRTHTLPVPLSVSDSDSVVRLCRHATGAVSKPSRLVGVSRWWYGR